jgi:uncharacterized protein YbbC (DUF1343 family)
VTEVRTGLDVLRAEGFARLAGKRVGLVTHPAAVSRGRPGAEGTRSAADLFAVAPGVTLAALFGPEHGLTAAAQDLVGVAGGVHPRYGVPVFSLYGDRFETLVPTPDMLAGLDVLVIDLQDVGSRYYTFQATALYCLEACGRAGLPVTVLDRPNPLGLRAVEGPALKPGFASFVGPHDVAIRHGLTMGELARLYLAERTLPTRVEVVACDGLTRGDGWPADLPWLPPSPNMPTVDTARVYPGMCLIEGTNLSEGRGTCRPFELVGHPALDPHRFCDALSAEGLPGVEFLPAGFKPMFQKHAGVECGGAFVRPTGDDFRPVRTGLAVLAVAKRLLGDRFRWRTERYEFVDDKPAIDLLFGNDRERRRLDAGAGWREIADGWEAAEAAFAERRTPYQIYPDAG